MKNKGIKVKTAKIRKAEEFQKKNYSGLHPLFGYVRVFGTLGKMKTSWTVPVEYLGEGFGEPNYEAILPEGLHLSGDEVHTVLGTTQADLLSRLLQGLEECNEHCGGREKTPEPKPDFTVRNEGSIIILHPNSDAAVEWVNEHIGWESGFQPYRPAVVIEPRYFNDILQGIKDDGLTVA